MLLSAGYFLALWPFVPGLGSPANLANLGSNLLPLLVVTLGEMFALITGGIDLSVTSIVALASVTGAVPIVTAAVIFAAVFLDSARNRRLRKLARRQIRATVAKGAESAAKRG
jgi:ribose/xylose/arabinose/galactoside ABC-type transport system permease subunit